LNADDGDLSLRRSMTEFGSGRFPPISTDEAYAHRSPAPSAPSRHCGHRSSFRWASTDVVGAGHDSQAAYTCAERTRAIAGATRSGEIRERSGYDVDVRCTAARVLEADVWIHAGFDVAQPRAPRVGAPARMLGVVRLGARIGAHESSLRARVRRIGVARGYELQHDGVRCRDGDRRAQMFDAVRRPTAVDLGCNAANSGSRNGQDRGRAGAAAGFGDQPGPERMPGVDASAMRGGHAVSGWDVFAVPIPALHRR